MAHDNVALEKLLEIKKLITVFNGLDDNDLRSIVKDVNFQKFAASETIIYEHDTDRLIYYILKGSCDVLINRQRVAKLDRGMLFGEMSTLLKQPRVATVRAIESDTTLISFKIDANDLSINYKAYAILFQNISVELSQKVDNVNKLLLS